jgi:hypothetical protein
MTAAPSPKPEQLISVIVGNACRGFLYRRRGEFEVFDIDEKSLGTFGSEREAIGALLNPQSARLAEQTKNSCEAGSAAGRSPVSKT